MTQLKLFDIPKEEKNKSKMTCRSCEYRYKHEYGKMFYCSKRKSNKTSYGHVKIKAGDSACLMYKNKLYKTKKCDWCKKRKEIGKMNYLGKITSTSKKIYWICDDCNFKHDIV